KAGDVRWPAMSADGKVIVFEHDFGVWKFDVAGRKTTPIKLDIAAETQENLVETREFNSQLDDYDLAPSGRRIALSVHGEIFTAPTDEGDLRQITDGPWRDKEPEYSPDGKWIAFISDRSGREEIYVIASDGAGEPQKITDLDTLKFNFSWSPNSKEIAFTASDSKMRKYTLESKQTAELSSSRYGNISAPVWSPDGKWIAFSKADHTRNTDVYLIPSAGGEERKVTFDSYSDVNPRFSPDGRRLYFVRNEGGGFGGGGGGQASAQVYYALLEREDREPRSAMGRSNPADRTHPTDEDGGPRAPAPPQRSQLTGPPREINIDWAGIKRRTRQLTRMPSSAFNYAITPDSRTIVFVTSEV